MCCSLDNNSFIVKKKGDYYELYPNPKTKSLNFFRKIELLEKSAELIDEIFHLFNKVFYSVCSVPVYHLLSETHHAAHQLEHIFHSFCFVGDVFRFKNWLKSNNKKKSSFAYCAARVCHATSHLLVSLSFLNNLEIISLKKVSQSLNIQHLLNAIGYAINTIYLIQGNKQKKDTNKNFIINVGIYFGGCVYESLSIIKNLAISNPIINKIISVAGIIHSLSIILKLSNQKIIAYEQSTFHNH